MSASNNPQENDFEKKDSQDSKDLEEISHALIPADPSDKYSKALQIAQHLNDTSPQKKGMTLVPRLFNALSKRETLPVAIGVAGVIAAGIAAAMTQRAQTSKFTTKQNLPVKQTMAIVKLLPKPVMQSAPDKKSARRQKTVIREAMIHTETGRGYLRFWLRVISQITEDNE
jgi:hypothetical protein